MATLPRNYLGRYRPPDVHVSLRHPTLVHLRYLHLASVRCYDAPVRSHLSVPLPSNSLAHLTFPSWVALQLAPVKRLFPPPAPPYLDLSSLPTSPHPPHLLLLPSEISLPSIRLSGQPVTATFLFTSRPSLPVPFVSSFLSLGW